LILAGAHADNGNTSMKYADGVTDVQLGDRIRLANGEEATVVEFVAVLVRTDRSEFVQKDDGSMGDVVFLKRAAPPR
jgi:hypothetical protein